MANQYINALTDTWNNAGTTFHAIKLNVTNSASAADSNLITMQIGGVDMFEVTKAGAIVAASSTTTSALLATANDSGALGASGTAFSDLFLASGGVINWNAGDITITHSANVLAFAGGSYTFAGAVTPAANDGSTLGAAATSWSDLFLASGGVINFANGNAVVTHSSGILTVSTGDLRVTTAGTNAASVATVGGTQTLTGKTLNLTSNTLTGTTAQFNTALSDGSFATLAGTETLTNKTMGATSFTGSVTVTGSGVFSGDVQVNGTYVQVGAMDGAGLSDGLLLSENGTGTARLSISSAGAGTHYNVAFYRGGSNVGTISTLGSGTAYNTTSDERMKRNFRAPSGSIVDQIRIYEFDWLEDGTRGIGPKAQELHQVAPHAVTPGVGEPGTPGFRPWGWDASKLMPDVILKLQALEARLAALERRP